MFTETKHEETSVFTSITTAISLIIALVVVSSIAAFTYYYKVMSEYFEKIMVLQSNRFLKYNFYQNARTMNHSEIKAKGPVINDIRSEDSRSKL